MNQSQEDDFHIQLKTSQSRRTYLITYSQVDLSKFPTRQSFGEQVVAYFNEGAGKVEVEHWACCREPHDTTSGIHYHLCLKLSGPKRWKRVKEKLTDNHGVVVNFSDGHDNYYTAYRYVTKQDTQVYLSPGHPNLDEIGSPKTKYCVRAYRSASRKRSSSVDALNKKAQKKMPNKIRRLNNLEVSEFVTENNVKGYTELLALAEAQKIEGKKDLANFILCRSRKAVEELIENTWRMKDAQKSIDRKKMSRMQLIRDARNGQCVEGCNRHWLECAQEVLKNNNIHPVVFSSALKELLTKGRGKFRNLLLVGCTCSGKTFLLDPLCALFKTFVNPAVDKYAWVGAEECEVIYLNDFRWSPALISWKDFLLLLEGHIVHLPAPKNQYSNDVCIDTDIPIFATSKEPIVYHGRNGTLDERETEMMAVRWRVFELNKNIPQEEQKDIAKCPRCFAELVLLDEDY
jgi:hypothetical protein